MSRNLVSRGWKAIYTRLKPLWRKTFFPIGHFYSPVPDRAEARIAVERAAGNADRIPGGITIDDDAMQALWQDMLPLMADAPFRDEAGPQERYQYLNGYYSYGDALVLHAVLRLVKPARLIEVGSGYSSAAMLDTRQAFGVPERMTCVEPYPQRLKSLLRPEDLGSVRIMETGVQATDLGLYDDLAENDILFIDSSHVLKTGSDLNFIMHEILPRLNAGVIVHFHDIFWPFEYPAQWAVDENRGWNEVYAIRAFLTYNDAFEILFFNQYFAHFHGSEAAAGCPLFMRNPGGGLWLRKLRA